MDLVGVFGFANHFSLSWCADAVLVHCKLYFRYISVLSRNLCQSMSFLEQNIYKNDPKWPTWPSSRQTEKKEFEFEFNQWVLENSNFLSSTPEAELSFPPSPPEPFDLGSRNFRLLSKNQMSKSDCYQTCLSLILLSLLSEKCKTKIMTTWTRDMLVVRIIN